MNEPDKAYSQAPRGRPATGHFPRRKKAYYHSNVNPESKFFIDYDASGKIVQIYSQVSKRNASKNSVGRGCQPLPMYMANASMNSFPRPQQFKPHQQKQRQGQGNQTMVSGNELVPSSRNSIQSVSMPNHHNKTRFKPQYSQQLYVDQQDPTPHQVMAFETKANPQLLDWKRHKLTDSSTSFAAGTFGDYLSQYQQNPSQLKYQPTSIYSNSSNIQPSYPLVATYEEVKPNIRNKLLTMPRFSAGETKFSQSSAQTPMFSTSNYGTTEPPNFYATPPSNWDDLRSSHPYPITYSGLQHNLTPSDIQMQSSSDIPSKMINSQPSPWADGNKLDKKRHYYLSNDAFSFLKNKNIVISITNFAKQISTTTILNMLTERARFKFNHYAVINGELWIEVNSPQDALVLLELHGLTCTTLGIQSMTVRLIYVRCQTRIGPNIKTILLQIIPLNEEMEKLDLTRWSLTHYLVGFSLSFPLFLQLISEHIRNSAMHLQYLLLNDNAIESTEPLQPLIALPFLRVLNLSGNLIRTPDDLRMLTKFPALKELLLFNNPITEDTEYRLSVLACIPSLAILDGVTTTLPISFGNIEQELPFESMLPTENSFFSTAVELTTIVDRFVEMYFKAFDFNRKQLTGAYRPSGSYFSCKVFRFDDKMTSPCKDCHASDAFDIIQALISFPPSKHNIPNKSDFLWLPNMDNQALLIINGYSKFANECYAYHRSITLVPFNIEQEWNFTIINDMMLLTQVNHDYDAMETQNDMPVTDFQYGWPL